ncbi:MAG: lysophospholipid acyltransferase family protein [Gemmiger sp.]|uniref:lysophospholipid acyltransferase family protein n=1 Tax=Gemmiger sp. TaxID=2049027 RepID=UPI002E77C2ED|nr:lysophospholipid acyltransferase family protein [Gemmiger sp.]MEE0799769.1 lysophospholipid acyltransferase family protein [Gemmiger sp.]
MLLYWILLPLAWPLLHIIWHIQLIGRENIPKGRAHVIASNHLSDLDPVYILDSVFSWKRYTILAKQELFRNPLIGWFLACLGAVPIDRGKGDLDTVNLVTEECHNGTPILIFPEGTRSKTGELGNLKSGAFVIAGNAGADMVPCRIIYDTPNHRMRPFCRIRICFGTPIPAEEMAIADPRRSVAKLRELRSRLKNELERLYEENNFEVRP